MKKRDLLGVVGVLCALPVLLVASSDCCDPKLDALGKTIQRISNDASQVEVLLNDYQESCCESCADILRSTFRAPQCSCDVTPITGPVTLDTSGSYCLANDITGIISTEVGVQVAIDLNGHTVNGSVFVSDHGYVHNGLITGQLGLSSYSRAESIMLGGPLQGIGVAVHDVLVRDTVLTHVSVGFDISNFTSLTLDQCTLAGADELTPETFTVENVVNLIVRDSYVLGNLWVDFSLTPMLELFSIYDSHITGQLYVYAQNSLSAFTAWDSAINELYVDFQVPQGTPSFLLHGVSSSNVFFTSNTQHDSTKIFIDECTLGRLIFQRVSNIHCQNTSANASPEGVYTAFAPVHIESCQSGLFQDVMATNTLLDMVTGDPGFYIANSKDLLFKKCFSIAEMGTGYSVAFTSTTINFDHCVAKGCFTGFWAQTGTSGSVINCIADGCGSTGFSNADPSGSPIVYARNVACFNVANYSVPTETAPYYDITYTVTAGSWRNISL